MSDLSPASAQLGKSLLLQASVSVSGTVGSVVLTSAQHSPAVAAVIFPVYAVSKDLSHPSSYRTLQANACYTGQARFVSPFYRLALFFFRPFTLFSGFWDLSRLQTWTLTSRSFVYLGQDRYMGLRVPKQF